MLVRFLLGEEDLIRSPKLLKLLQVQELQVRQSLELPLVHSLSISLCDVGNDCPDFEFQLPLEILWRRLIYPLMISLESRVGLVLDHTELREDQFPRDQSNVLLLVHVGHQLAEHHHSGQALNVLVDDPVWVNYQRSSHDFECILVIGELHFLDYSVDPPTSVGLLHFYSQRVD